jgi:hypothetical protein
LERNVVFKFAALLSDVNVLQAAILSDKKYDVSSFAARLSVAFLPPVGYQLMEYGSPRIISRRFQEAKLINFENHDLTLHKAIELLAAVGIDQALLKVRGLDEFDLYLLQYQDKKCRSRAGGNGTFT